MPVGGERTSKIALITSLCFIVILGLPLYLNSRSEGYKFYKNYTPMDYDAQDQNRCIIQDNRGIIYIANNGGVLLYDGLSWRLMEIPNDSVYSLAVGSDGTVYIGGNGEIGCLVEDSLGRRTYRSLTYLVPGSRKDFSKVFKIHPLGDTVHFRSREYLFQLKNGTIKPWKPKSGHIMGSFSCNGKLYVRIGGQGLCRIKGNSCELIAHGEEFASKGVYMMAPYIESGTLLIGTRSGFYTYNGSGIKAVNTEIDAYLEQKGLYHGIPLENGEFALVTRTGGVFVIDAYGGLNYRFDEDSGLQDNGGWYVFQDNQYNLWLALDKGVTKIEYSSPFTIYDKQIGLPGSIRSAVRHGRDGVLYVGTNKGLFSYSSPEGKFHRVQDIRDSCTDLLSTGDSLLAATNRKILRVTAGNTWLPVINGNSNVMERSSLDSRRIWVGTTAGLTSLYLSGDGRWGLEYAYGEIKSEIITIVEDRKRRRLWLGLLTKGVRKAVLSPAGELDISSVTGYGEENGLPGPRTRVFWAGDHVVFATDQGIFRYDEPADTFVPDTLLGGAYSGGAGKRGVYLMVADTRNDLWIHSERRNLHAVPQEDGRIHFIAKPFLRIPKIQVNTIFPEVDREIVWFGSDEGLFCYDTRIKKEYRVRCKPLIQNITANQRPIFAAGVHSLRDAPPIIEYRDRNLHFEFAAPLFEAESATTHRCWLEGYEDGWSPWSKVSQRDYTNLDNGVYTFHVKSRDVYGIESEEAVFRFKVLPPWFKTWWAIVLFALLVVLAMFFIVRWRSGKLEREKQHLEHVVKDRTREIHEKNSQLEAQTAQLMEQAEKLKEMDQVKSRFFANISHEFRTPLTLIMGPLEKMLSSDGDTRQRKSLKMMLRNSQRLLALINQLLELSRFDSGKMKMRACQQNIIPFLTGLIASFEPAATQKQFILSFQAQSEDITLYFDSARLEDVVLNLMSNAVKFTPPGGRVTVKAAAREARHPDEDENFPEGSLELRVSDTGPGIPREQLGRIFERFYQAGNTYEHNRHGSGIGLAIAKEEIELHHGKIEVHSHEGEGTEFVVRLPLGCGHLSPGEITQNSEVQPIRKNPGEAPTVQGEEDEPDITGDIAPDAGSMENPIDLLEPAKDIVLVVDDSADIRDYIRGAIEEDYTVVEAKDGREGAQRAMEIIPDLIISDIVMPGADGYELCRTLKNDIKTSHVPIILLTARASEESILKGLETGADDYVTKPFSTRILCARIKNLVELRQHLQKTLRREMTLQPVRIAPSPMDRTFLQRLKDVIRRNISDPEFNIDQLCKKMGLSQPTIYRKIRALSGESPTHFIRSYRLMRGAELLKKGCSVLEVALEVGFPNANYFTRCFKQKFHMLPSTYRESGG